MTGGLVELIAGAIAKQVVSKLGELAWKEAKLLWRFKEDATELEITLTMMEALTRDAEIRYREAGNDIARLWLRNLKSAAYNIEDVLDEFNSEELIWKNSRQKIKLVFSTHNRCFLRLTMPHKMKKVRKELKKLWKEQNESLRLVDLSKQPNMVERSWSESFSASVDNLIGRDGVKEEIMSLVLQSEVDVYISIIPIIGLGGLGKTTLAQAVYEDKRSEIFDIRAWVYVSETFDLKKIGKDIISGADNSIDLSNCTLDSIKNHLKKILHTRRYLIILDDFWEQNGSNLQKLKQLLQYGMKGSKIIITTRVESVVQKLRSVVLSNTKIGVDRAIKLEYLSTEDCWEIMKQGASFEPSDDASELEKIGLEIADKCCGVPLVASSLGYILMSQEPNVEVWSEIRDTKMVLDLKENEDDKTTTLGTMMLSYYHMQPDYKLCFVYCAIFPKGFVVDNNRLIQQWAALGYIDTKQGQHCIDYLLGMSFLHISKSSLVTSAHNKTPQKLTMHDLVHDLATEIAKDELFVLDFATSLNASKVCDKKHCRHARLVHYDKQSKIPGKLLGKVRSLHFTECSVVHLREEMVSTSKYLRILDLSGCSTGKLRPSQRNILLPLSVAQLKLLRYLDASGLAVEALPKSLHTLQNIQTLILSNTTVKYLPNDIGNLDNLCYLDLSESSIQELPMSFVELARLSYLNLSRCTELEGLPKLIDKLKCLVHLDMSECYNFQNLPLESGGLPKLSFLNMSGCSKLRSLPEDLRLTSLEILNLSRCHGLEGLPDSFGNLGKLKILNLSDCYKVQMLPASFCQLKKLKILDLSDCHGLKELHECFGNLSELQSLNLTSCSKLHFLPESFCKLSKMTNLDLSFCVKLENLPSPFGELKLQNLDISGCVQLCNLPDSIMNMTTLTHLDAMMGKGTLSNKKANIRQHLKLPSHTTHCVRETESGGFSNIMEVAKLTCSELAIKGLENVKQCEDTVGDGLRNNSGLRLLYLQWEHGSSRLHGNINTEKDKSVLEKLLPPRTLKHFALEGYMSKDFPEWMKFNISLHLPSVTILGLFDLGACDNLPPFGQLPNLRSLVIKNMPNLRKITKAFYGEKGACVKLRIIQLRSMEHLEEWWMTRSGDEDEEFLIPNLHLLDARDCPKLKFLPYPPKSVHWLLNNSDEVLPANGFGRLESSTIPFSMTIQNSILSESTWNRLGHLSYLERLVLLSCKNLKTLPQAVRSFRTLRVLEFVRCDVVSLPEWLGELQSLQKIVIVCCSNLDSLPDSIRRLALKAEVIVEDCPRLMESCRGYKISRIPEKRPRLFCHDFEPWNLSGPRSFF
ncbi:unnamed protein product [Urochloa decumbens]|uniref:Uncharacterized protein n=1 Tax=Urochloa decumbens TaxID=240449 RepID=A0ABC9C156_9POAL